VKIRGHRIELGEIETVLGSHRSVAQAIVVVFEPAPGDKRLVAYVVLKPGSDEGVIAALRPHLQRTLPDYMLPSVIVPLAEMPLNANGKVDRRRLPAPDAVRSASYVAPRTPTEERLAGLWQDVLGRSDIGVEELLRARRPLAPRDAARLTHAPRPSEGPAARHLQPPDGPRVCRCDRHADTTHQLRHRLRGVGAERAALQYQLCVRGGRLT
jgi:hypothetical protein